MKNITQQAVKALGARQNFNFANTKVVVAGGESKLILHGSEIAKLTADGKLFITTAGWNTRTTFERLRHLPGVSIQTIRGTHYLNGKTWDGSWTEVTERVGNQPS
jgi:hypothetical protein